MIDDFGIQTEACVVFGVENNECFYKIFVLDVLLC
jgi:hypothetical protein